MGKAEVNVNQIDSNSPADSPKAPKLRQNLVELTGSRFFASLAVLLLHTATFIHFPQPIRAIALQGRNGVSFFFILSGFILTHTYGDRFRGKIVAAEARRFLVHRVARVYPLHLLCLLIITPISLHLFGEAFKSSTLALSWLANLTLVQDFLPSAAFGEIWNAPAWSIGCEAVFYLSFPMLIRYIDPFDSKSKRILHLLLACYILSGALFITGFAFWVSRGLSGQSLEGCLGYWIYRNPFCRIFEFAMGCCLYASLGNRSNAMAEICSTGKKRNSVVLGALAWLALLAVVCGNTEVASSHAVTFLHAACWYLLPAPAFCLLILALASGKTLLSPILTMPFIVLLGEASYAMYMIHWIAWGPFTVVPNTPVAFKVAAIVLIVPTSILVYRFIEAPLRYWVREKLHS